MKKDKVKDFYFHKAKRENFSARSVYKLQNIQEKYKILAPGNAVLDLGASPGSWSEYICTILGKRGRLAALDIKDLSLSAKEKIKRSEVQFDFFLNSVFEPMPENLLAFDAVVSDMAPSTQGNRLVDSQGSLELALRAFEIASSHLKPGGHFVVKLFQSEETVAASKAWAKAFKMSKLYRPPATHKDSKEVYFIGLHFSVD